VRQPRYLSLSLLCGRLHEAETALVVVELAMTVAGMVPACPPADAIVECAYGAARMNVSFALNSCFATWNLLVTNIWLDKDEFGPSGRMPVIRQLLRLLLLAQAGRSLDSISSGRFGGERRTLIFRRESALYASFDHRRICGVIKEIRRADAVGFVEGG